MTQSSDRPVRDLPRGSSRHAWGACDGLEYGSGHSVRGSLRGSSRVVWGACDGLEYEYGSGGAVRGVPRLLIGFQPAFVSSRVRWEGCDELGYGVARPVPGVSRAVRCGLVKV